MSAACKSCGGQVVWTITVKGKQMPVDVPATPNGNLVLVPASDPREAPTARYATTSDRELPHYTSHFATCPQAVGWRRP